MARVGRPRMVGTITRTGAFFEKDPGLTIGENARRLMEAVAAEGERDAQARIASLPPAGVRTGATRRRIVGRARSHRGKPWRLTAVIGIPNVGMTEDEAIRTYAAMAAIERRYHPMRATSTALRGAAAVNRAELTRGL